MTPKLIQTESENQAALARLLESGLGIPAEVLLQQPGGKLSSADTSDYAKQDDPDILNDSEAEDA